jgi:hypothetical protein
MAVRTLLRHHGYKAWLGLCQKLLEIFARRLNILNHESVIIHTS